MGPAHLVECTVLELHHSITHQSDERGPLRPGLARVAPLQVAREDDVRLAPHLFAAVDVPERPVVVAAVHQAFDAAGRVAIVPFAPVERGVQEAQVEGARNRRRVALAEVVGDSLLRKTLPVDRDVHAVEHELERVPGRACDSSVTFSGGRRCCVRRLAASWLPRIQTTRTPASLSRAICWQKKRPVE